MQDKYPKNKYPFIRFFLGDIRDLDRLSFATRNIENIIHRIPHFAPNQEVIFVEGHSQDGTYQEIQRVISQNPGMDLVLLRQLFHL